MIPLVDTHCHLLAGLDDGPRTADEVLEMCSVMLAEGVQLSTALAHQNDHYPANTPDHLRAAARRLAEALRAADLPLTVFPSAEVMVHPGVEGSWERGELLSYGDHRQFLLLEMPHGCFVDLGPIAVRLRQAGVRVVVAHAERYPELLHTAGLAEQWIEAGCLIQASSAGITAPRSRADARAVKTWLQRGIVHVVGSDGHSPRRRPPRLAAAYRQAVSWAGAAAADRIFSTAGMALLHGWPLRVPPPRPAHWLAAFWG